MVRLALVEDDTDLRAALTGMLARAGYTPEVFESAEDFLGSDSVSTFDLVVSEFPMEGSEGAEVLKACRAVPDPPAILLVTGRGSVVEALEAARPGAIDYVGKPVDARELAARVGCALELRRLRREVRALGGEVRRRHGLAPPIGESPFMQDFLKRVGKELILAQLFLVGTAIVIMPIAYVLCVLPAFPAAVLIQMAHFHLLYQLYGLYLQRGGTAIPLQVEAIGGP